MAITRRFIMFDRIALRHVLNRGAVLAHACYRGGRGPSPRHRRAASRRPFGAAEMILRGEKTIEYRSRPTKIIGERFLVARSGRENAQIAGKETMACAFYEGS
jgi:hypothetical protein